MLRIIGSAALGVLAGAVSGIVLISLLGAISGIPFIIEHAGGKNDPIMMFLAGAVMYGFHLGIPLGFPIGAILGLLVGTARGFRRVRGSVDRVEPIPSDFT